MSNERQADITNPLMANLIRQYAHERQLLGEFNGRTAEVVRGRLMGLAASCEVNPFVVTRRDIRQWLASLDGAPATRGACLSAVRTFYEWMNEEDLIHHNPALGIKRVKVPKGENRSLTDEELARIREVLPDGRSELIFSLMYGEALPCLSG